MAGHKYGEVNYKIGFDIDMQSLNNLKKELQAIQNMTTTQYQKSNPNAASDATAAMHELVAIKKEAETVEAALKKAFNVNLGTINLTKFNQELKGLNLGNLYRDFSKLGVQGQQAFRGITTELLTTNTQMRQTHQLLDSMATSFKNTVKWGISSSVWNTMTSSIQQAWTYTKALDKSLNDIRIVSGQSADQMERFAVQANRAAQALGASTLDYTKAALIYYQQGLSGEDVTERTDITLKMANVLGASAQEVSSYMTAIWNNFDDGSHSLEHFADVITALGAATASSSEEIATGLEKFAAIADTVGLSYEYATTALATVVAQTRQSADVVGTAFKTLFARIQSLKLGETLDDGTTLGKYSQELQKVGISIKDQKGELKDMNTILDEMGAKWQTLSRGEQAALAQAVAGTRQYTQLVALMDNWGTFQKNLEVATNSTGTLQKQQEIYMDSIEAHLEKLGTAGERLKTALLDKKGINSLIDGLTKVVNLFSNFTESIGGGSNLLLALGSVGAQVFGNQIASSIATTINNLQSSKTAIENIRKEIMLIGQIKMDGAMMDDAIVGPLAEISDKIAKNSEYVSKEVADGWKKQVREAANEAQKVADKVTEYWKRISNVQALDKDYFATAMNTNQISNPNIDLSADFAQTQPIELQEWDNAKTVMEDTLNAITDRIKTTEDAFQLLIKTATEYSDVDFSKKTKENSEALEELHEKIKNAKLGLDTLIENNSKVFTKKQLNDLKSYSNALEKYLKDPLHQNGGKSKITDHLINREDLIKTTSALHDGTVKIEQYGNEIKKVDKSNEELVNSNEDVKKSFEENLDPINENINAYTKIGDIKTFVNLASGIGQLASALNSLKNIGNIWNNEDLTTGEKILQIITALGTGLAMLGNSFKLVKDSLTSIGGMMKKAAVDYMLHEAEAKKLAIAEAEAAAAKEASAAASATEGAAEEAEAVVKEESAAASTHLTLAEAQEAAMDGTLTAANIPLTASFYGLAGAIWTALAPLLPFVAAAAAVVVAVVAVVEIVKIFHAEEESLQKTLETTNEVLEETKKKHEEFLETLDNYKSAREQIDSLTEGTIEYYNTLVKVNEEALKLINTLNLVEGKDYTVGANGLITISKEAQERGAYEQQRKVWLAQADNNWAQYKVNENNREKQRNEIANKFKNEVNKGRDTQITTEQARIILQNMNNTGTTDIGDVIYKTQAESNRITKGFEQHLISQEQKNNQQTLMCIGQVGGDITKAITEYGPQYQKIEAESQNELERAANSAFYAYMDKEQSEKFAGLSDIGKNAMRKAFTPEYQEARNKSEEFRQSQQNADTRYLEELSKSDGFVDKYMAGFRSRTFGENLVSTLIPIVGIYNGVKDLGGAFGQYDDVAESYQKGKVLGDSKRTELNSKEYIKTFFEDLDNINAGLSNDFKGISDTEKGHVAGALVGAKYNTLQSEDLKTLTLDEWEKIQKTADQSQINNITSALPDSYKSIDDYIQHVREYADEWGRLPERIAEDLQAYNNTLKQQAEELGTTQTALNLYAEAEASAGKITNAHTQETATAAAASYKFNKTFNEARNIYEDNEDALKAYSKALKKGEQVSYDTADAVGEIVDKLQEMGVYLKADDLKNDNVLKQINKLLKGTEKEAEEAYKELYNLSRLNVFKDTFDGYKEVQTILQQWGKSYQDIIDEIDNTHPGDNLSKEYAENLSKMIQATGMTVDEINELANKIGITIPVTYQEPPDFNIKDVKFTTAAQVIAHRYKGEAPDPRDPSKNVSVDYSWTETIEPKTEDFLVPDTANFKVNTNRQNLSAGTNTKISSSGKKSGGGNDKPDKMDPIKNEIDRYHKVNTQITKVDNSLKKLQSQQDKFIGNKKIANLNAQWKELNTQISNYNEKLRIAVEEQKELANELSKKGVQFNADGTVSNYAESLKSQEAYVNSLIDKYNSMSKKQQESYKETVEKAKEDFEEFKKNIDRYDELVSDFIPDLQQSVQDAIDEQIEINVQKFNMEIEITLNMDEATREWNAWVKRAIQGFDDENIFGNAQARLKDFYTYFNENGAGDVQVGSRHVNDTLAQLQKMDRGEDNVYGDNREKGLEDLKNYYTQLMQSITDVIELQDELHQDVLDEMDEVQDKFSKQIESYEYLREIFNHDMQVIQLTLGDDAYGEMAKFYEAQQNSYEKQLDFQRQQKDFWYAEMQAAEEGSKEWESARDKWKEAVNEFNAILEEGLQNAADKFENTINNIFKKLNNSITNGMGLDYVNTAWDLINQNADRYLDTVNASYAIRQLEKKYTEDINKMDNTAAQQKLKKVMDEQLENLKERERITQYDVDRANKLYELELAKIALEEAQQNKSQMRLRRDSQGNYTYQYTADKDAIGDAEDKLNNAYNDLYNFDKERYNTVLNDIYDIWNNYQSQMAEAALINDPELRAEKELLIQEQYNELMLQAEEDYQVSKSNLDQSFFWDWIDLKKMTYDEFKNLTESDKDLIKTEMIPTWKNALTEMADAFAGEDGFTRVTIGAWNEIKDAENVYAEDMKELETISGQTYQEIINGEDEAIAKAEEFVKDNKEVIDAYGQELSAVQAVYNEVKKLRQEYEAAEKAAIAATEAAYKYWQQQQSKAANDAKNQTTSTSSAGSSSPAPSSSDSGSSAPANTGAGSGGGGNGTPEVGETVTYQGGKYFSDSYGGGKSGSKAAGTQVKISIVKNGRPYPIHITTTKGGALGWIRQDQIVGYDTGGYTGTWGNNGKLAMLHQKELVLNAEDTENMLNTVAIMRNLAYSLGSNVLSKLAGASANGITGGDGSGAILEQQVHIDATFPNVRDAAEIEAALNNLVNSASQRIYEKR